MLLIESEVLQMKKQRKKRDRAGYMATDVACGWAGAVMKKA